MGLSKEKGRGCGSIWAGPILKTKELDDEGEIAVKKRAGLHSAQESSFPQSIVLKVL